MSRTAGKCFTRIYGHRGSFSVRCKKHGVILEECKTFPEALALARQHRIMTSTRGPLWSESGANGAGPQRDR